MARRMNEHDVLQAVIARTVEPIQNHEAAKREALAELLRWHAEMVQHPVGTDEFWNAQNRLQSVADRLSEMKALAKTVWTAGQIVDPVEVFDLPCGHRDEDLCVACSDVQPTLVQNRATEVARREQEAAWATYSTTVLAEHEAGVDAKVAAFEAGGAS